MVFMFNSPLSLLGITSHSNNQFFYSSKEKTLPHQESAISHIDRYNPIPTLALSRSGCGSVSCGILSQPANSSSPLTTIQLSHHLV